MKKILLITVVMALLLCGCARELPAYELPPASTEPGGSAQTHSTPTKPWEEFNTYPVELDVDDLLGYTDHEIVFLRGKYAQYYDFEMHRAFAFCSQPNCTHSDESCPSYFGGDSVTDTDYVVVGDSIYAVCTADDWHTIRLRQLKPLTGEKTDLYTDTLPEPIQDTDEDGTPRNVMYYYQSPDLLFTGSALILQYQVTRQEDRFEVDKQTSQGSGEKVILRYDLNSGTMRELLRSDVPVYNWTWLQPDYILDASDRYALLRPHDSPMTMEEYMATGASEEEYNEYIRDMLLSRGKTTELQIWDLETGEKNQLCTANELRMDSDSAFYQHKICYVLDEQELWLLDLHDGSKTKLLEVEEPANFATIEQWDGRVFFSRWRELDDGTGWFDRYWYEPATGELRQYQVESSLLQYRIMGETDRSFYVSGADGGYYLIDKQDYYNENYDAAQNVGMLSVVN